MLARLFVASLRLDAQLTAAQPKALKENDLYQLGRFDSQNQEPYWTGKGDEEPTVADGGGTAYVWKHQSKTFDIDTNGYGLVERECRRQFEHQGSEISRADCTEGYSAEASGTIRPSFFSECVIASESSGLCSSFHSCSSGCSRSHFSSHASELRSSSSMPAPETLNFATLYLLQGRSGLIISSSVWLCES